MDTQGAETKKRKVVGVYYVTPAKNEGNVTGLFLVLEDGVVLRHQSTDLIMPFEEVKEVPEALSSNDGLEVQS